MSAPELCGYGELKGTLCPSFEVNGSIAPSFFCRNKDQLCMIQLQESGAVKLKLAKLEKPAA